ncbi:hypothetical protein MKW92_041549 [Papaver armeniacum]|nr:hypothetical protein MKW92_041549 [Papaver armeniacum]
MIGTVAVDQDSLSLSKPLFYRASAFFALNYIPEIKSNFAAAAALVYVALIHICVTMHTRKLFYKAITNADESEDETEDDTRVNQFREFSSQASPLGPVEGGTTESASVNVYSYYKKHTDCGEYAVILRNSSAKPIAARDNFSLDGKSYLFQVLSGLLAGLSLSSDHGCYTPYVRCNSRIVVTLLCQIASRSCKCEGSKIGKILMIAFKLWCHDCFQTLVPLIELLHDKYKYLGPTNFACVSRKMNEAAHYLAKEAKKDALSLVDYEKGKLVDYEADMKPNEFPEKLVSFLLNDAYDSIYYNSDARGKLEESVNPCD